jgi:hypothetical protein
MPFFPEKVSRPNATRSIVSGSPNEIAVDTNLGDQNPDNSDRKGSFNSVTLGFSFQSFYTLVRQNRIIWPEIALY